MTQTPQPGSQPINWDEVRGLSPETREIYEKYGAQVNPDEDLKIGKQLVMSSHPIMSGEAQQIGNYTIQAVSDGSTKPPVVHITRDGETDQLQFPSWQRLAEFVERFEKKRTADLPKLIDQGLNISTTRDLGGPAGNRGSLREAFLYAVNL